MPKRNIYLSDDDIELWDSLPKGQRGTILRDFLLERKIKSDFDLIAHRDTHNMSDIEMKRADTRKRILDNEHRFLLLSREKRKILNSIERLKNSVDVKTKDSAKISVEMEELEESHAALVAEYNENFGGNSWNEGSLVSSKELWDEIYIKAKVRTGEIFTYPPKRRKGWIFKIKSVKNKKIEIERLDHPSGPTSTIITLTRIEEIIEKFNRNADWQGESEARIKSGLITGDHSMESAIVLLYDKMKYDEEWILFS